MRTAEPSDKMTMPGNRGTGRGIEPESSPAAANTRLPVENARADVPRWPLVRSISESVGAGRVSLMVSFEPSSVCSVNRSL